MIVDFHTHAFPKKIASHAIKNLSDVAGGITPCHSGTVEDLKQKEAENGVNKVILLNIATNPNQEHNVNSFAISLVNDEMIIPFGSINPDSENIDAELKRLSDAGIKGIKLHPDYQGFFVDEKRMLPIYERIASYGFITVFHSGVDIGYPRPIHCTPKMLRNVLRYFDKAPVIAAHLGGFQLWDEAIKYLSDTEIYIDTAFSYGRIKEDTAKNLLNSFNKEKILFGTDMPWSNIFDEINYISKLCENQNILDMILYKNAHKLLNIY